MTMAHALQAGSQSEPRRRSESQGSRETDLYEVPGGLVGGVDDPLPRRGRRVRHVHHERGRVHREGDPLRRHVADVDRLVLEVPAQALVVGRHVRLGHQHIRLKVLHRTAYRRLGSDRDETRGSTALQLGRGQNDWMKKQLAILS